MYEYKATLHRIIDGDTIVCCTWLTPQRQVKTPAGELFDMGFRIYSPIAIAQAPLAMMGAYRLAGVKELDLKATARLRELLTDRNMQLSTHRGEEYGHWAADVMVERHVDSKGSTEWVNVNGLLVEEGLAERVEG